MVDKQNKNLEELDKENIADIFYGLVDSIKKEVIDSNQYKYLEGNYWILSLYNDNINLYLINPYMRIVKAYIRDRLKEEEIPSDKELIYLNILLYYNLYEEIIKELVRMKFGDMYCADKAHTIINEYLYFLRTSKKRYHLNGKYVSYSIPEDYDPDFWFKLIEALDDLRYGRFMKFLTMMNTFCSSFSNMEKADDPK